MFKNNPTTPEKWHHFITKNAKDRCDLDILLKDKWRHRVVIRDEPGKFHTIQIEEVIIDGKGYSYLQSFLQKYTPITLHALSLTALQHTLYAYGHGNQTVTAVLNPYGHTHLAQARLFPSFVDHPQRSKLSCESLLKEVSTSLEDKNNFFTPTLFIQRALFDAAFIITHKEFILTEKLPFPLAAMVIENHQAGYIKCQIAYAHKLFEEKTIQGVLEVMKEIILQIAHSPHQRMERLELASPTQRKQLLKWNHTEGDFPSTMRLNDLVEKAAQKTPDLPALVFQQKSLTYSQLNKHTHQIAHWLVQIAQIQPNELIALYLDKNESVVLTILSIWKAGAAFLPIDVNYPSKHVRFMIEDSGVKYIITNEHHTKKLHEIGKTISRPIQIFEIENIHHSAHLAQHTKSKANPKLDSTGLAYVTYTSGTTGVPKGVPKIHSSVVNSITDLSIRYHMLEAGTENVALFASYVFEPFMRQMLIALINSQTLVIVPDEVRMDPDRFPKFLKQHKITYLNGTGSVLQHFDLKAALHLKRLLLVGEELTQSGLKQLREQFTGEIINEYAFTEAAFVTAIKRFAPHEVKRLDRSIGKPLRNVKCYVLSQNLKQLPIGAIGELYIGGMGVASGYLNREDLTKQRFLSNPLQTDQEKQLGLNNRIYKTGDLARMLPSGEFEYMGRSDFQLKLNGVRVEPGEIEAKAMTFPGIKKCVIVPKARSKEAFYLVGYFVAKHNVKIKEKDLINHLEEHLISVMVPARMMQLEHIPVNINGKVDWRALPDIPHLRLSLPAENRSSANSQTVASQTPHKALIKTLQAIWSSVLNIPVNKIRQDDDFFRLGGQSIACVLLVAHIRKQLKKHLTVTDVFKLKTLASIAHYLAGQTPSISTQDQLTDSIAFNPSNPITLPANGLQQGLLYHALKSQPTDDAYIMQSLYRYHHTMQPDLLKKAWQYMLAKYPGLNVRFEWNEKPLQIIAKKNQKLSWHFKDLSTASNPQMQEAYITEIQKKDRLKPYQLNQNPLFRLYLIKQARDLFTLILSYHHIILDGWSLPILHHEVHRAYSKLIQGNKPLLEQEHDVHLLLALKKEILKSVTKCPKAILSAYF